MVGRLFSDLKLPEGGQTGHNFHQRAGEVESIDQRPEPGGGRVYFS